MADEIKVQASIEITNNNFRLPKYGASILQINQNNPGGGVPGTVEIPVADTLVDLSALTVLGFCWIQNIDANNYVTYGPDSGGGALVPFGRIRPGENAIWRFEPGVLLRMLANTAPVEIQIVANED